MDTYFFMDNAKVMSKGQVTIPKEVRKVLGISSGDRVTFSVEAQNVRVVNAGVFALQILGDHMKGEGEKVGLGSEEDVMQIIKAIRNGDSKE